MQKNVVLIQQEPRGPSELVEVAIPTTAGSRVNFPDIPQLRSQPDQDVIIKAVRVITDQVLTTGPSLGLTNAPKAELQKIAVVFYSEGWEKGHLIPALTLNDMANFDTTTPIPFKQGGTTYFDNWKNVDWPKSYLQFAAAPASTPYEVILEVEYVRLNKNGQSY